MNLAQSQLQAARDAHAPDYAPVDMGFAQDKFQQAQSAMAQRKYADAAVLASESQADAELAAAKGRLGMARAQIQQKTDENNRLRTQDGSSPDAGAPSAAPAAAAGGQPQPGSQVQGLPASADSGAFPADSAAPASPTAPEAEPGTAASTSPPLPSAGFQPVQPAQPQAQPQPAQSAPSVPSAAVPAADAGQTQGVQP